MPLFDVLMPVKNGQAFLEQAMRSIQAQTVNDWRLLVLDHGSTDDTPAIVQRLAQHDPRIQWHSFPSAPGLAGLLNEGLAMLQAPYAMRMDADDEALPERMALTEAALRAQPHLSVVGGQTVVIDADGRRIGRQDVPTDPSVLGRVSMFRNPFVHPTVCFRSAAVQDRHLRYGRSLYAARDAQADILVPSLAEDYLLFAELALEGAASNVAQVLLRYRYHAGGVSQQKFHDQMVVSAAISRHLAGLIARRVGMPAFDPAPFCTHGEALFNIGNETDYATHHAAMCEVLRRSGGVWAGGDSELDWRTVFIDHSPAGILCRAAARWWRCRPSQHEARTVRNSVLKRMRRKPLITVPPLRPEA